MVTGPELGLGHDRMAEVAELRHAASFDSQHLRFTEMYFTVLVIFISNAKDSKTRSIVDKCRVFCEYILADRFVSLSYKEVFKPAIIPQYVR